MYISHLVLFSPTLANVLGWSLANFSPDRNFDDLLQRLKVVGRFLTQHEGKQCPEMAQAPQATEMYNC